jgi:glycosyltransferase involved in cell wall biosynthesis
VVIHGSRVLVDKVENVKKQFPPYVQFIEWKHAGRELNPANDMRALFELISLLKPYRKSADTVIHLHSSKAGFLGRLAARVLGIKRVIYTPHCGAFVRTDISPMKRDFFRGLEKLGGSFGGIVVGCGRSEAETYSRLGRPAAWVSNGVPVTPEAKDPHPTLVSFSGVAGRQKDPGLFSRIAESFSASEAIFCWIGDGALRGELKSPNIRVTGWVKPDAVQSVLNKTLIYLSTSSWEGLPFGVLEAMNASCALLLKDVPGNRDLVVTGRNGYLFHSEKDGVVLLKKMLQDFGRTIEMGKQSREMAENQYSLKQMGEGYRRIYENLVAGKEITPCLS